MSKKYVPLISNFADFCECHKKGELIFLVDGKLHADYDLLVRLDTRYRFPSPLVQKEIEEAIQKNMYFFDVRHSNMFFWPNDNMFSMSNAQYHIPGLILTVKEKYQNQWNS